MATYRLGIYGFDALVVTGATRDDVPHPVASPEARLRLAAPAPVLTQVVVMAEGNALSIAHGSGIGIEGQVVDLALRLAVEGEDGHHLTCAVLRAEGVPIGLLATAPLREGVTYRVTQVAATDPAEDPGAHLLSLDTPLAAGPVAGSREVAFCFTSGTLVDTPDGPRLIDELSTGDLVTTLGNGSQPLRWIGHRHVPVAEMLSFPDLQPVEFAVGTIGNHRPLRVSPQHRMLLNDWRAQVYFAEDQVLIPAKAMINGRTIRQVLPAGGVTYVHLLFDRHEIIVSDGALSESFHPGESGLQALDDVQRREIERLFPGLDLARRRAAFPILKLTEARAIRLPD
jgi:hypothetical protein